MELRCPDCASPEVEDDGGERSHCDNCGARFEHESCLISLSEARAFAAELGICTCDSVRGCPQCFQRAEGLLGALIRDPYDREWLVENVDEKDGFPTVGGGGFWAWAHEVIVLRAPDSDRAGSAGPHREAEGRGMRLFQFHLEPARRCISDPDGAIWPVNSYSDADELNSLFEIAMETEIIRSRQGAQIHIHPLSISEPEPVLAIDTRFGPSLLGDGLRLREREDEDPVQFTLRLLEEVTAEANALAGRRASCLN